MFSLSAWWVWIAGALVFAILEVLAPVFVFLGFAAGAAAVGVLLAFGVEFGGSVAAMVVVFAAVSLVTTVLLRLMLGARRSENKRFTDDINDR